MARCFVPRAVGTNSAGPEAVVNALCTFVSLFVKADHPEVPETAVIGYPHKIKGEGT